MGDGENEQLVPDQRKEDGVAEAADLESPEFSGCIELHWGARSRLREHELRRFLKLRQELDTQPGAFALEVANGCTELLGRIINQP